MRQPPVVAESLVALLALVAFAAAPAPAVAQRADNPHGAITVPCASCHSADAWKPARVGSAFRHAPGTFPLEGAHAQATCLSCHRTLDFKQTPTGCSSCHTDVHRGELGTTCARCHSARSFVDDAKIRRAHELTRLPLRGAHAALDCESCHQPGASGKLQFAGRPVTCGGCHARQFRATRDPDHRSAAFSQECASCHTVSTWRAARFDHAATRFRIDGAHRAVACAGCHGDRVYSGKATECVACHRGDFAASTNPPHAASGFPTGCTTCHTTAAWTGATFDHAATRFTLTGGHRAVTCIGCHGDGVYRGKPTACASCHQAKYAATTTPAHAAAGFPTTCESCHTTTIWTGAVFDHAATRFPLTNAHRAASCRDCHGDGVYRGKPTACVSCHQAKYAATTTPAHAAAGFPTTCESCHTTITWTGALFNHATTRFPLTGAHVTRPCAACHGDGVYRGKPTVCSGCHLSRYNGTTNPSHAAAQFPTTCESCHTTSTWLGATFNHDGAYFPIYTGKHRGTWSTCADCHTSPANFASFTCLTCHGKTKMDDTHRGRAGYRYDSPTCYSCHPRGTAP